MEENVGCELDLAWINEVSVNAWCVYNSGREAANECRKLRGRHRAAWLLKSVSCLDLTTLSGDDTSSNVKRLTCKAAHPIPTQTLKKLKLTNSFTTAAVCVYPDRIKDVVDAISHLSLPENELSVAGVAAGFPSGQFRLPSRLMQIKECVNDGANEIDVVVNRSLVLTGQWDLLYQELKLMKKACGKAKLKTILGVGELGNFRNVYKASLVAMMAGSDFIKTSTGKEVVNATLPVGIVMMRAIQAYYQKTSYRVGFKAAGGIKTSNDVLNWLALAKKELGQEWLNKSFFRIGASGVLQDIERELFFITF